MRASQVLQKCLTHSLSGMHALRERALLRSVEALLQCRRLTLMDVARAWSDAIRIRAPLKALIDCSATGTCTPNALRSTRTKRDGCCAVHGR